MNAADLGREGVEAFNAGDWDRMRETMTPDSVYEELGTQRRIEGADEILAVNRDWKTAMPDATGTVRSAFGDDEHAVIELVWEGTQDGPLPGPTGEIPPTHRRFSVPAVMVVELRDGKIAMERHYFDLMTLLGQLGVLPQSAATSR